MNLPVEPQIPTGDGVQTPPVLMRWSLPVVSFFLLMAFLAVPLSFEAKAHALLHGLCAQTPSHTLELGGRPLPFDARMTGIYVGFIGALIALQATFRKRAAGVPSIGAGLVLLVFVGLMAVDGFNSLFGDLGLPQLYQPDNRLRLFTGLTAGIALGAVLSMLMAMTIWSGPRVRDRVLATWWEPLTLFVLIAPVAAVSLTGHSSLYYVFSALLIVAAVTVLSLLALVVITMIKRLDNQFGRWSELQREASIGVLLGIVVMLGLASMRFALEAVTGAPPLT
jgi:uncharacterized membrane protein